MFSVTITQSTIKLVNFCVYTVFWKKLCHCCFCNAMSLVYVDQFFLLFMYYLVECGHFAVKSIVIWQSRTPKWEVLRGRYAPLRRGMADSLKTSALSMCFTTWNLVVLHQMMYAYKGGNPQIGECWHPVHFADPLELRSSRRLLCYRIWAFCVKRYERY